MSGAAAAGQINLRAVLRDAVSIVWFEALPIKNLEAERIRTSPSLDPWLGACVSSL
jgi:hypothetical protein